MRARVLLKAFKITGTHPSSENSNSIHAAMSQNINLAKISESKFYWIDYYSNTERKIDLANLMLDNPSDSTFTLRLDSLESTTKKLSLKVAEKEKC